MSPADPVDLGMELHTRRDGGHEGSGLQTDRLTQDPRHDRVDGVRCQSEAVPANLGLQHTQLHAGVGEQSCEEIVRSSSG